MTQIKQFFFVTVSLNLNYYNKYTTNNQTANEVEKDCAFEKIGFVGSYRAGQFT